MTTKHIFLTTLVAILLSGTILATGKDSTFNPNREDYKFVALFEKFRQISDSSLSEKIKSEDLLDAATELADCYFENTEPTLQNRYIEYLQQQHDSSDEHLRSYYPILGQAFYGYALRATKARTLKEKQNRILFTLGGSMMGVILGAASYHLGLPIIQRVFGSGINKSLYTAVALYGGGLVIGSAAGYGAGRGYNSFVLPIDTKTKNGIYFAGQFASGDQFINRTFESTRISAIDMDTQRLIAKLESLK